MEKKLASTTTVINLIGGPGIGKSTLAAKLYAHMKEKHMDVEMVREVAKEWALEGKKIGPFEQISILGEQIKKESSLFGNTDYIVTDSPILLGGFYCGHNHGQWFMYNMVKDYYRYCQDEGVKFINIILPRNKKYIQAGRFEDEEKSRQIDAKLIDIAHMAFKGNYLTCLKRDTNQAIIRLIMKELKNA